jgi:peptide/nickel transport system substrate-binding protein/oligopeptide transport system substrate-binding protein
MNYGNNPTANNAEQQQNQQLMAQADGISNQTTRMAQYNRAEQALVNDVAWLPVGQEVSTEVIKPCVQGIINNAQGLTPPDDWHAIYISNNSACGNTGS